jgi:hypothetical protein
VSSRKAAFFVEALLSDRRPAPFRADTSDAEVLRAAIAIRAERPGDGAPSPQFVADLRQKLALQAGRASSPPVRSRLTTRARLMLAAAAVASMGGTVAATATVEHALAASSASHVAHNHFVRVGEFDSATSHDLGEIFAYRGEPSWVVMSIRLPGMNGTVGCRIEMKNGAVATAGTFVVHNGIGNYAKPVSVDVGQFRKATLVSAAGSVLATASFGGS